MTQHIQLENVELDYLLSGEDNSETLLFVHGLGANLSQFEAQQQALSKKFKVLSVNLRGHGNTKLLRVSNPSDFELSKMANDIVEVLKKLDISKNKLTRGEAKYSDSDPDDDSDWETDMSGVLALAEAIKDS